ncbi:MAG: hypothetical protein WCG75_09385 [Armatimonadota bacterium]
MKTMSGIQEGPLPELKPVLKKWILISNEYVHRSQGNDASWWFNERASLSTVSAATWLAKGIAVEEYTTTKRLIPDKGKPKKSDRGRCDLYISVRSGKRDHYFVIEAKPCWPDLTSTRYPGEIAAGIEAAREDVRHTNAEESRRLGLLLVSPVIPKGAERNTETLLEGFIEEIRSHEDCAVAWTFPGEARRLYSKKHREYYPGAAILIKPLRLTR